MSIITDTNCAKCGTKYPEVSIEVRLDKERNGHRLPKLWCLQCLAKEISIQQIPD